MSAATPSGVTIPPNVAAGAGQQPGTPPPFPPPVSGAVETGLTISVSAAGPHPTSGSFTGVGAAVEYVRQTLEAFHRSVRAGGPATPETVTIVATPAQHPPPHYLGPPVRQPPPGTPMPPAGMHLPPTQRPIPANR